MAFVDLEKAFDRVPREVLWWTLKKMNVPEKLLEVIKAMYCHAKTAVRTQNGIGDEFEVKVGVHQDSALSPQIFTIVLEALSKAFRSGSPYGRVCMLMIWCCCSVRRVLDKEDSELEEWF